MAIMRITLGVVVLVVLLALRMVLSSFAFIGALV